MRPNTEEVLRGAQGSLLSFVLPEVQTEYGRQQVLIIYALLGIAAGQADGAAQRLVDDNAALRALARRGADALAGDSAQGELRDTLDSLAHGSDASVRLADLSTVNGELRAAIARLGAATRDAALRADILSHLRAEVDARSFALMGPRADG